MADDHDLFLDPVPRPVPPAVGSTPLARHRPRARARRTDPETSHQAAQKFSVAQLRASQYEIFRLVSLYGPAHHEELVRRAKAHGVKQKDSGIRTRCAELVARGVLMDSGRRVTLPDSHRESIVWAVNPNPPLPTATGPSSPA